ncbi:hypothetical protein B0H21DRAFT_771878 [Amylocystis lapponica]|nr:hypothetical protein B0H21DRAFT_771878 [Amylocystis lapponica]
MALELLEDKKTLVGSLFHGGSSQQWRFSRSGSGYTVQNASATGLYMRVEDNICDTAKVVVAPFLASWNVQVDGEINGTGTLTIRWPETNYVLDLAESGTKVQLSMTSKNDNPCQTWRFIQLQFHRLDRRQRALNLSSRLGVSH